MYIAATAPGVVGSSRATIVSDGPAGMAPGAGRCSARRTTSNIYPFQASTIDSRGFLAMEMVRRSGLTPYVTEQAEVAAPAPAQGRMPICITGLRKGEKLFEELLIGNDPRPTAHPQIMTASETALPMAPLRAALARLLEACDHFDLGAIVAILRELPLDYTPGVTEDSDPSRSGAMSGAAVSLAPAAPRLRRQAR